MTAFTNILMAAWVLWMVACGSTRGVGPGDGESEGGDGMDGTGDWSTDGQGDGGDAIHPDGQEGVDGTDGTDGERCYEAGCPCSRGETTACYEGDAATRGVGPCHDGLRTCGAENVFSRCIGQLMPSVEVCDGIDNTCDGRTDEGLLNACGGCGPVPAESCGNSLDDDCDGTVDEDCDCDPGCLCPEVPDPSSPCECHPPTNQPCYDGPPATLGMGECAGGLHDCVPEADGTAHWGPCVGQVLPGEECTAGSDGRDNDCDGMTDEGCLPDGDGDGYPPPEDCDDTDAAVSPGSEEVCDGIDNNCNGLMDEGVANPCGGCGDVPAEACGNSLDDDCDGLVDENCECRGGDTEPCYTGPLETQDVGQCRAGAQTCIEAGGEFSHWGPCEGEVPPSLEVCDGEDNDCDRVVDERWAVGANRCGFCSPVEVCDGEDNDCDGFADEGLRNACGDCLPVPEETLCDGEDEDCDGLVDEYLVNGCGECPPAPCYQQPYPDPGDCTEPDRNCDGVVPYPDDPTAITLGQSTLSNPFIYIAVTGRNELAKLDTVSGAKVWQVSSYGTWPSRTAVALDYTVWVGNRGFGDVWNVASSNVVHLAADGSFICRADVPGLVRGVAIDASGSVWAGTYDGQSLWKISGTAVDTSVSPARCQILGNWSVGVYVYGLTVDGSGHVWTSSCPSTIRWDIATSTFTAVPNSASYGIAVSPTARTVWYGNWGAWPDGCTGAGTVHGMLIDPPYTVTSTAVGPSIITAVTVDHEGFVWGSGHADNRVYKIDPTTGAVVCSAAAPAPTGGGNPHGIAEDAAGKIWAPNRYGGWANRFLRDCTHDGSFEVDNGYELYTYSDMTGMQLRTVTVRQGHWIQNYDSGYDCPTWHTVDWLAEVPAGTSVTVTAVAAHTEAELVTAPTAACGPFTASPGDMLSCADIQCHRWLSLDVALSTTMDGVRPVVHDINVYWSY